MSVKEAKNELIRAEKSLESANEPILLTSEEWAFVFFTVTSRGSGLDF